MSIASSDRRQTTEGLVFTAEIVMDLMTDCDPEFVERAIIQQGWQLADFATYLAEQGYEVR
jgi:hypothetical protein